MSYRNKTYVIFDGDNDMWAYAYMKGWKQNERIDFSFVDAHDLKPLTDRASEETIRRRLRERLSNTCQAIVLIGTQTKHLYRFVRWEMDTCLDLDIPIVAVNLNGKPQLDTNLCPPILRGQYVVHVSFERAIIQYALDNFPGEYLRRNSNAEGDRYYDQAVYQAFLKEKRPALLGFKMRTS
jgi:hypothetical protein